MPKIFIDKEKHFKKVTNITRKSNQMKPDFFTNSTSDTLLPQAFDTNKTAPRGVHAIRNFTVECFLLFE